MTITIYTDGGCIGNPGPGGYGVVILGDEKKEISGGFKETTNNRMELFAVITALETLKKPEKVTLYSDSKYVVDGMEKGWAKSWQANRWKKSNKRKALNVDLWKRLLALCDRHDVKFVWVQGHNGNRYNERCDKLSNQAARKPGLPPDPGYSPEIPQQSLF